MSAPETAIPLRGIALTALAVTAFAANSLLCRLALQDGGTDPVGFTVVRMGSAALVLFALIASGSERGHPTRSGNWISAAWLFGYAIAFSWVYVALPTGTGALLLFGAVQTTMIVFGLATGERPTSRDWIGLTLAAGGVVYLMLPGATAPELLPATWMVLAGVAWGFYSLRGRGVEQPGAATCGNFIRTVPMVVVTGLVFWSDLRFTKTGLLAALGSGAIASGLGYILWYHALAYLTATRAAIVQLVAPVLAAVAGVLFLGESLSWRLAVSAAAVFAGVTLVSVAKTKKR